LPRSNPQDGEVEGARLGDLLQAEDVAVEAAAAGEVGDDHRDVVDVGDVEAGHEPSRGG
jgi:hypothetical protein